MVFQRSGQFFLMSNQYNCYNKVGRQLNLQTSPIYKYNSQYEQSPFKKLLAVIPESQVGDQRKVFQQNVDNMIQSPQFLCQSYSQRLYDSVDLYDYQSDKKVSAFLKQSSQSKGLLLAGSISQKQKQLKQLQNQLFMIKNTNECLRDTIKQNNIQRNRLVDEIQTVKQQNTKYLQRIAELQLDLERANQCLLELRQPQEQQYFAQNSIMSKSLQQLVEQNESLKESIQEVKRMYERQIDIMIVRHGEEVVSLQTKWSALVKEKDGLIKELERRKQQRQRQMNKDCDEFKMEVAKLKLQKSQMLSEYLQTIQAMRVQLKQNIKTQLNSPFTVSNPILISQPYIIDYQPTRDNIPIDQCSQESLIHDRMNKSKNSRNVVGLGIGNSLSLNQSLVVGDINNTIVSEMRGMSRFGNIDHSTRNKSNFRKQFSKQRSNTHHRNSSSLTHLLYSSKHKLPPVSNNSLSLPYNNVSSINSKLFRDIDNKLDRIKNQINKEITY